MKTRKVFSLLLVLGALFALYTINSSAVFDYGNCGANVEWLLDTDKGTLTISGTGPMYNYTASGLSGHMVTTPWASYSESIKTVKVERGVTSIGNYAFYYCKNLTSVTIPDSVTSIGKSAFYYCHSLANVTIPDSVTSIGDYAFNNCESFTKIVIPDSVRTIGDRAFWNCYYVKRITIGDSAKQYDRAYTTIGLEAFDGGARVESITIGNNVLMIGKGAFSYCSEALTSITIPDGVTSIGKEAFWGCSHLSRVSLGKNISVIGDAAFYNCDALRSIVISKNVRTIGMQAFAFCDALTSVTLPRGLERIGESAFYQCPLTSITLRQGIKQIDNTAFGYCESLKSVVICGDDPKISESAFRGCTALSSVTFAGSAPTSFNKSVFSAASPSPTLHVPKNDATWTSSSEYKADWNLWGGYKVVFDVDPDDYDYYDPGECPHLKTTQKITRAAAGEKDGAIVTTCLTCTDDIPDVVIAYPGTVVPARSECEYDGTPREPAVAVYDRNSRLVGSQHYDVSYQNNVAVGTATVTVTFKGDYYTGSLTATFTITEPSVTFTGSTIPSGAVGYVALYSQSGKMLAVRQAANNASGYAAAVVPAHVYDNMASAKLFILNGTTLRPVKAAVKKTY